MPWCTTKIQVGYSNWYTTKKCCMTILHQTTKKWTGQHSEIKIVQHMMGELDLTPSLKVNMAFLYSEWLHFLWHGMKRFIFEWSIEKHQKYQRKHLKRPTMVRHSLYTYWPWEVGLLLISIKIKVYVNNIIWLWKMFYSYDACKLTDNMQWTNMEKYFINRSVKSYSTLCKIAHKYPWTTHLSFQLEGPAYIRFLLVIWLLLVTGFK